jgi:hypothetical protein
MQTFALQLAEDWQADTRLGSALDSAVHVSSENHPALVPVAGTLAPGTVWTGADIKNGTSTPPATLTPAGNAWRLIDTILVSSQSADAWSISTTGAQLVVQLTGILASGLVHAGAPGVAAAAIRNGGLVQLLADGAVVDSADLAFAAPQLRWSNPDAAAHTLAVRFTGAHGTLVHPLSAVVTTGTGSMAPVLAESSTQTTFSAASWRLLGTAGNTYTLYHTPQGGVETSVATGLAAGTTYDDVGHIPGVRLRVPGPTVVGEQATFRTDVVMCAVVWFRVDSGGGGTGTARYLSPIFDSGASDSHFLLADFDCADLWTGATSPPMLTLSVGQSAVPDASWQSTPGVLVDPRVQPAGTRLGTAAAGFLASPRARYAQLAFTFPTAPTYDAWIRDLWLYAWVPERDPALLGRIPTPPSWTPGPSFEAVLGSMAAGAARARQDMLDLVASYAISTAASPYLEHIGADLGLAPYVYSLIPPAAYSLLLRAVAGSRPEGGSVAAIATEVAELLAGAVPTLASTVTGGLLTVLATSTVAGVGWPVQAQQTAPGALTLTVCPQGSGGWPGLAGVPFAVAQQIVTALAQTLRPMGCQLTIVFNPSVFP